MKIKKICKVKNYRIFRDFSWQASLPEFKDYNLVYGWNGSGKTVLSNIFRDLDRKCVSIAGSEFEIETEAGLIKSENLGTTTIPFSISVFNREFIADNVFKAAGDITPIFVLGEDSVEKQKEIGILKKQLLGKTNDAIEKQAELRSAEKDLDTFNIDKAKEIKQLLSSSGDNPYNNYDKAKLKDKCKKLKEQNWQAFILNDEVKNTLKKKKEASPEDKVPLVDFSFANIANIVSTVNAVLAKTIVSNVVERLKNDSEISNWVSAGLNIHREKSTDVCLFCEQPLPNGYLKKLEGHFNDEYNNFISTIEKLNNDLQDLINKPISLALPNKAQLYEHLRKEYEQKCRSFEKEKNVYIDILTNIKQKVSQKKTSPFMAIELITETNQLNRLVIDEINHIIEQHNSETDDFYRTIIEARNDLENSCVAEVLSNIIEKEKKIDSLKGEYGRLCENVNLLKRQIENLERGLVEHRRPAEELNKDLAAYLGRDELKFEIKENGYQILRNGELADALSEGEKTAIAFLYFLKSLKNKNFMLLEGIVVIDDPVSSLDANLLFHAFGFMKERTKNAGQLFIFTHNFCFFRQVKNWFTYINKHSKKFKKEASFYMLQCEGIGASRQGKITNLDRLLIDYESEYHYLFSLVYHGANLKSGEIKLFYHLPNISRRLLEAFLAFRRPSKEGLYEKLEHVDFDSAKKARILRFLQTHSHGGEVDDPEHDISILSETPEVLKDILDLFKSEDKRHFEEMEKTITTVS